MNRPYPPMDLLGPLPTDRFLPSAAVERWAREAFLGQDGALYNSDHRHLINARVGFLWTDAPNGRHGRVIVGQAEMGIPAMGRWAKARATQQLEDWFGIVPDFVVTLYAPYAAEVGDAEFCSLVEHELYHCAQATDAYGAPRFNKATGRPIFTMRGHDVEEFVGVVRRYGVGAAAGSTAELVEAAKHKPEVASVAISQACGTCLRRAA